MLKYLYFFPPSFSYEYQAEEDLFCLTLCYPDTLSIMRYGLPHNFCFIYTYIYIIIYISKSIFVNLAKPIDAYLPIRPMIKLQVKQNIAKNETYNIHQKKRMRRTKVQMKWF